MTKRQKLQAKINANKTKIEALKSENIALIKQTIILSDNIQQYEEKLEITGRGKNKREVLVGRIHWKEDFKDDSTGEVITIERSDIVKCDDEWFSREFAGYLG
jgi:hypothetical protein